MKAPTLTACRHFMRPIVRFLLRNGVTWDAFQDVAKTVFVEIARADYGLQGRPTNNTRVAMLTGLSRREVASVRKKMEEGDGLPPPTSKSRITEILTGWHTDDDFLDERGKPRELPADDEDHGFAALLKRYAGDMPHIALTKEMLHAGVMEAAGDGVFRVLRREFVHSGLSPDLITYMGSSLHDHAATLAWNLDPERTRPARFERRASNLRVPPRVASRFMALVEERGEAFLEDMDEWLSRHELDDDNDTTKGARMGVGVYAFYDHPTRGKTK